MTLQNDERVADQASADPKPAKPTGKPPASSRISLPSLGMDRFSGVYLWAAFILVFAVWSPNVFMTQATAQSIASAQAVNGMIALALLIPLVSGTFDLSVGANANLVGIMVVIAQVNWGMSMTSAILLGMVAGAAVGVVNAFVVVVLKVNSFIGTLGTASVIAAVQVMVTKNEQPLPPSSDTWSSITQHSMLNFQVVIIYLLLLALVLWWVLDHTPAGRYLYAVGANPEAARLAGVRPERWVFTSLVASGFISGIAGILYCSLIGPSLAFGPGLLLPAFCAAFLGATQLRPGVFNVWGTLLAIFMLATGVEGLRIVLQEQWVADLFNGLALIIAVAFSVRRRGAGRGHP